MRDEEPVPLGRIIRSLETLQERQLKSLQDMQAEHEREMKELKGRRDTLDNALLYRDFLTEELERVIATLCVRIERVQSQLKKDNQNCVFSEPLEILNLLGRNADPTALIPKARQKAREAKLQELERQRVESLQLVTPQDAPVDPPCRVCGHHEDRHTEELPEEGGANYCAECSGDIGLFVPGNHSYDGAIQAAWDRCLCGHVRSEHKDGICAVCHPDHGQAHEFALKR